MNNLGITLTVDDTLVNARINDSINISNNNKEWDLENNNELNLCRIMTMQRTYLGVDDVFKSVSGNYYVEIYINNTFVKMDIDLIVDVFEINSKSNFLSNNWRGLKENLKRKDKINRILKDE